MGASRPKNLFLPASPSLVVNFLPLCPPRIPRALCAKTSCWWGAQKRRPAGPAVSLVRSVFGSGGLGRLLLDRPCAVGDADLDLARLQRLGDHSLELHVEETVLEARALHLDEVGELEAPLEGAARDAAVERAGLVGLWLCLAGDGERAFLRGDVELLRPEAGDRHGQAIGVIAGDLDVVGRVAPVCSRRVGKRRQAVEAEGGAD